MKHIKQLNLAIVGAALMVGTAHADFLINDDLIVDGSACIGFDCVNGESFGFDTLRLKENNLRIRAFDTSTSASFPSNDWQITFNETSNGGANKFSIDDIDGGRTPFTIEAGTPSHSLYVDDGGRIGLGTSTPVVEIHVKDGDTPTLRLEQDGSSGFTPQTWDVAGNETNFFVRDATNGSTLPFRIRPTAPSNSIYVDTDGDVGLGTTAPGAPLHVIDNGSAIAGAAGTMGMFQNTLNIGSIARLSIISGGSGFGQLAFGDPTQEQEGQIQYNHFDDSMDLLLGNGNAEALSFSFTGDVITTSTSSAVLTQAGVWQDASSRELKRAINALSIADAVQALESLTPVTYIYKNDPTEDMNVGFIAEDVPELVATSSRKTLASLDIIAVLTKVVQDQRDVINGLAERLQLLEESE